MITPEHFKRATGREPENDDLERCNCQQSGEIGHTACGWDNEQDLPVFMTGRSNNIRYYRPEAMVSFRVNLGSVTLPVVIGPMKVLVPVHAFHLIVDKFLFSTEGMGMLTMWRVNERALLSDLRERGWID